MIQAKMLPGGVEISGHAVAGPHGQDLVCAAVSALTYTLAAVLAEKGRLHTCEIKPGYALITTLGQNCPYLDMMEAGLTLLAKKNPENISLFSCRMGRDKN